MTPSQLDTVKTLIGLLTTGGVAEIEVMDGDFKVRISARPGTVTAPVPPALAPAPAPGPAPGGEGQLPVIHAAMHGTYHHAPAPGAPAFVKPGDAVAAGQQLCIIEAMKVFTAVRTTYAAYVRQVHAKNGQDVAAGDPLFTLERA